MTDPFEYDVFISFSSADEEIVKPLWQELCSNGLRVFWSDSSLKKEIGNSWFEVIEKSLERSKHMLLVCSNNSMSSKWVQREYRAFFDYCYSPNSRRLIPLLAREFLPTSLPLFLRELQVGRISNSNFIQEIIPILGGVNIEKLQQELKSLQEQVDLLLIENRTLRKSETIETNKINEFIKENKLLQEQILQLKNQSYSFNKTMDEQEKVLISENLSLKEQIIKLNNEISLFPKNNSNRLLASKLRTEKKNKTQKQPVAKLESTYVTSPITQIMTRSTKKTNHKTLNKPAGKDKEINALIESLQSPMSYIREATLKDINRRIISDTRIIELVDKLATSDRVDTIRNLAKKTLITLKSI